jgi:hypothetical protein
MIIQFRYVTQITILLIKVFCSVMPCSLVDGYQHFREMYHLYLQISILNMEAIRCSEMMVTTTTLHDVTTQNTTINIFNTVRTSNSNKNIT